MSATSPALSLTALVSAQFGCAGILWPNSGAQSSCRIAHERYSDGTTRSGWSSVVIDSRTGRDIYISFGYEEYGARRLALEQVMAGEYSVQLLGDEKEPSFLWARADNTVPVRTVVPRIALNVIRTESVTLTEPKRPEIPAPDPNSSFASFLIGAVPGVPISRPGVPISMMSSGTYLSRDGHCFWIAHAYGNIVPQNDCKPLADLEANALRGERIVKSGFAEIGALAPEKHLVRGAGHLLDGGLRSDLELRPLPGSNGDLAGVADLGEVWLAQWTSGGKSWLLLHSRDGKSISPAMGLAIDGELLEGSKYPGLVFLRWRDGLPVEATIATAIIERAVEN